jgi:hypothetical protein
MLFWFLFVVLPSQRTGWRLDQRDRVMLFIIVDAPSLLISILLKEIPNQPNVHCSRICIAFIFLKLKLKQSWSSGRAQGDKIRWAYENL